MTLAVAAAGVAACQLLSAVVVLCVLRAVAAAA